MSTTIEVDENLLADAMKATGASTEKETVELGLALLIKLRKAREGSQEPKGS